MADGIFEFFDDAFEFVAYYLVAFLLFIKLLGFLLSYRVNKKPVPKQSNGAVFVTGASSGIGRCIALSFADKGFNVFATVRKQKDFDSLNETCDLMHPIIVDVTEEDKMKKVAEELNQTLQERNLNLICVIANAGVLQLESSVDQFELNRAKMVVDVNVVGVMQTVRFFTPLLSSDGRMFVSGSYFGSSVTGGGLSTYSGSKYFLEGYCDGIRKSFYNNNGDRAISILKIGNIKTSMNAKYGECGPEVVFNGIWESLNSAYPKPRIYSGSVGGMPCWLYCFLCTYLPTSMYDLFTSFIGGGSNGGGKH